MARITIEKRDFILEREKTKKFKDKLDTCSNKIKEHLQKKISKTVPSWITQKEIDSLYIRTSCSYSYDPTYDFSDLGISERQVRLVRRIPLGKSFPSQHHVHQIKMDKTLEKLLHRFASILKERNDFAKKLRNVLSAYTTDKKLIKDIPELKEYFKDSGTSNALVPVEAIREVREMIR